MEDDEFRNKMEQLKKPEVQASAAQRQIKLALLNTQKSAWWGFWVLVIPIVFLCCVVINYLFQWNWSFAERIIEWFGELDKKRGIHWLTPVIFVVLPAIGAIVNLLAITHFVYDKKLRELIISIKLRWINIILALISIMIVAVILLYVIMENAHHAALEKYD